MLVYQRVFQVLRLCPTNGMDKWINSEFQATNICANKAEEHLRDTQKPSNTSKEYPRKVYNRKDYPMLISAVLPNVGTPNVDCHSTSQAVSCPLIPHLWYSFRNLHHCWMHCTIFLHSLPIWVCLKVGNSPSYGCFFMGKWRFQRLRSSNLGFQI